MQEKRSVQERLLFAGSLVLGLPILVYSLLQTPIYTETFIILTACTALASFFPVRLPSLRNDASSVRVTASDVFIFTGILLMSPEAAVSLSAVDCVISNRATKQKSRILLNLAIVASGTFVAGRVFYRLQETSPPFTLEQLNGFTFFALTFTLSALLYTFFNSGLVSLYASFKLETPWLEVFKRDFLWSSLTNFTGVLTGAALFAVISHTSVLSLSIALPVVLIMYYSYRMNNHRVQTLQESQNFLQSTLDSLSTAIAILDASGVIMATNDVWNMVGGSALFGPQHVIGSDYIDSCDSASPKWHRAGRLVSSAIKEVINGKEFVKLEYSSSDEKDQSWYSVNVTRFDSKEIDRIVVAHEDITELRKAEKRIIHLAYYDELTGLPNRAFLIEHLKYLVEKARRSEDKIAILNLDLDNFERINNSLGHQAGDELLRKVASRLCGCLRQSDCIARDITPKENIRAAKSLDTLIRIGGDEFLLVLNDIASSDDVASVAERIQNNLSEPFHLGQEEVVVYTTIGIALFPQDDKSVEGLLKGANSALYHAKKQGCNTYSFYSKFFNSVSARRLAVESQLRKALELEAFSLQYQPRIEAHQCKIVGAEALLRLPETSLGTIGPGEFIPIAEENGLIMPITEWVLETACSSARNWQKRYGSRIKMSVNLSARHFRDGSIVDTVSRSLNRSQLSPKYLELEITEGLLMEDFDLCVSILTRLKDLGLSIALDDFGTGFSSLNYLSRLPIDTLKIDRSFIKDLVNDKENQAIIRAVVAVSRTLGLQVVAEGVETETQLLLARELGCQEIQGYLFSPPLKSEDFVSFLRADSTKLRAIS